MDESNPTSDPPRSLIALMLHASRVCGRGAIGDFWRNLLPGVVKRLKRPSMCGS